MLEACGKEAELAEPQPVPASPVAEVTIEPPEPSLVAVDKWALWTEGTQLRGANIYQRRVYPELDGPEFMGSGSIGPPYIQQDLDQLAALGANYVNISHPGLFAEEPPFELDSAIQANLDRLLNMIAQADMFAVISFRTGPGRSEFTFFWDEVGDWFDRGYLDDSVWQDPAAQDAWLDMWRYTAQHLAGNPIVVGYDLMVEPNSNEVGSHALDDALDIWEAEEFYDQYGGTLYDWNQLYPRITEAIRQVDANTPVLVGGLGYSAVEWLPYLRPTEDPRTVYVVHQYAPYQYTHQGWNEIEYSYPGPCDLNWDGQADEHLSRAWLEELLSTVVDFAATHGVPVAVNEFGVVRWVPGADGFTDDQMDLFEEIGMNSALWIWDPAWVPWTKEVNAFNFRHGPDPANSSDVPSSDLRDVIVRHWGRNRVRPSSR
jgi:sugar phosphate isomerase/epimerase